MNRFDQISTKKQKTHSIFNKVSFDGRNEKIRETARTKWRRHKKGQARCNTIN